MIQKLGKYAIVEKLGEGSMGAVYKAYDGVLDRYVAIKTMASDIQWNPELKLRFYREAKSAANIHHPNIVTIHDLGEEGKITYIVMELLQGGDLKSIITEKTPLPLEDKLSIIAQVADGLNHAHANGIIHRDIKPGNIHVSPTGVVKILDFGIAHIPSSDLTQTGTRLGTPVYMSPEQIRGKEYDARTDMFSTGIVFYELTTYVHPFRDKKIAKTLDNILFKNDFEFDEQFPDAPPGLWPILSTCLAKEPKNRYDSMADLCRACRDLIAELTLARHRITQELEAALPPLRQSAESGRASPGLIELIKEGQKLLAQKDKPDYLSLSRLLAALSKDPLWPAVSGFQSQTAQGSGERSYPPILGKAPAVEPRQPIQGPGSPIPPHAAGTAGGRVVPAGDSLLPPKSLQAEAEANEARRREALQSARQLIEQDRLDDAIENLRKAIGTLGPHDDLVQLLADTKRTLEERKRARVAQLMEVVTEAMSSGELTRAAETLNAVLELEPEKREAVELRRQVLASLEIEKTRQAKLAEGERDKQLGFKLLGEKKFQESLNALRHAAELLGEDTSIRLGIEDAEEGLRTADLRARTQSELDEALRLFRAQDFDKARSHLNRLFELAPKHALGTTLLDRINQAQEEKRKNDLIASLLSRSEQSLNKGDIDQAAAAAADAQRLNPAHEATGRLLNRIAEARDRAQKEDEAAGFLSRAAESLEVEDFAEAEDLAKQALTVIPNHVQAGQFLRQVHQAREDRRKKQEIAQLLSSAEEALDRQDIDQCESLARRALGLDATSSAAKEVISRATQARENHKAEQIRTSLRQAQTALANEEFQKAAGSARDILLLDPHNQDALGLLADIDRIQAKRKQDEIAALLSSSQSALSAQQFDEANKFAQSVLDREAKHKEARALLKEIDKARRAFEKAQKKEQKSLSRTRETPPARDSDATVIMAHADQTVGPGQSGSGQSTKMLVWAGIAVVVLGVAAGAYFWMNRRVPPPVVDVSAQLQSARSLLEQKRYDSAIDEAQRILSSSPNNAEASAIIAEVQNRKRQSEIDVLMLEAQNLRSQNLLEESNQKIQKVLDLEPAYQPALEVRSEIEASISASKGKEEQDQQIRGWVESATTLLAANRLAEAKSEIDKIERLRPGAPEIKNLSKRLAAKTALAGSRPADSQPAGQNQKAANELIVKAEDLFREGKYSEAQSGADQFLSAAPHNSQAQSLRSRAMEAIASMKNFEASFASKSYDAALAALQRLEKVNPSDPNIAELRKRAESSKASAKASFTILRLGEAGSLTLDDQHIGAGGEVENKVVSAGRHKLAVRSAGGKQSSADLEFIDGQNLTFVYDTAAGELRAITPPDLEAISRRKQREEIHDFKVEHQHGFLKGKCSGTLLVSGLRLEYKPSEGDHRFAIPFQNLQLSLKEGKLEFTEKPSDRQLQFKPVDAKQASTIKKLWDTLEKLGK